MTDRPEQVLANWRERAQVLRANGHKAQGDSLDAFADELRASLADYLTWLSESEAVLRSGWTVRRLRGRFAEWAEQDMAERRGRVRWYRQVILPKRPNLEAARADAERMAGAA